MIVAHAWQKAFRGPHWSRLAALVHLGIDEPRRVHVFISDYQVINDIVSCVFIMMEKLKEVGLEHLIPLFEGKYIFFSFLILHASIYEVILGYGMVFFARVEHAVRPHTKDARSMHAANVYQETFNTPAYLDMRTHSL